MTIKWLESQPKIKRDNNWGIPWEKGDLSVEEFEKNEYRLSEPLQSKIMAYWPDGGIKWTGHSGVFTSQNKELIFEKTVLEEKQPLATEKFNGIYVNNGISEAY